MRPGSVDRVTAPHPWLVPHAARPLGALVDHTLLRPEATGADIQRICREARDLGLGAVCVHGRWVAPAARYLEGAVPVVAVVGFPQGAMSPAAVAVETRLAVADGAREIDVVQPLGLVKAAAWTELAEDLSVIVAAAMGRPVKVILETAALTDSEIDLSCAAAARAGAAFVKTSTGFHPAGGATTEAVERMRRAVGGQLGVKASGGIRTVADAIRMLRAGADRIGTSAAAGWGIGPGSASLAALLT